MYNLFRAVFPGIQHRDIIMKISVFGIGYVGLVQAAVFSNAGHEIVCVDIDEDKIEALKNGTIPIYEPGLQQLVDFNLAEGRLQFTSDAAIGVNHGDILFIAVGTPPDEDGSADMKYLLSAARSIASHMDSKKVIVNKSTVPVGTADSVRQVIEAELHGRNLTLDFHVVSNPEFLKEGAAVADCTRPDRIIVGTESEYVKELFRELYTPFNRNHDRIIFMDVRSAELTKYAANCMLATKISFMNELANIAEGLGANIESVRVGIGSDERIGYHFIYPGCGYGGSCFPKDVRALIKQSETIDKRASILSAVENVNNRQKTVLFEKLSKHFEDKLDDKMIALWGLSFKPNTDDMRDAPSRLLMEALWAEGCRVQAFDPVAMDECRRIYGERSDLSLVNSAEEALQGADALVLVTEWQQFKAPDFDRIKSTLKSPVIFDGRNQYEPELLKQKGITYYSIGRQTWRK